MSWTSRVVLATSSLISAGIVIYVHSKQEHDLEQLHLGVLKDQERQRRRKIENTYRLQQQTEITKALQKEYDSPKT